MPYFLPGMLPQPDNQHRGVISVTFDQPRTLAEANASNDVLFSNVRITMYDDGNLINHIDSFVLQVHDTDGNLVDMTKWNTLRPILGKFTIGGTITISKSLVNEMIGNGWSTAQVTITVHVHDFGSSYNLDPYQTVFTFA